MSDRSRDVSVELSEVRTVLSRAETALDRLEGYQTGRYWRPAHDSLDPDAQDMMDALKVTIEALSGWRRSGTRKKR